MGSQRAKTEDAASSPQMEAATSMPAPQPPPSPPAPAPLPPEHVDHAAVFYNEIAMRKQVFELGLAAIDAEIEGKKIVREDSLAELKRKYEDAVGELERTFVSDMGSLDKRRSMMVIGIEMAGAALDRWPAPEEERIERRSDDADAGNSD